MVRNTSIVALVLATLFVVGCASRSAVKERDAMISNLEARVNELEGELGIVQDKNAELQRDLEEALAEYQRKEQLWIEQKDAKSIVTVSDAVLFNSGSVQLSQQGKELIDRIAGVAMKHSDRSLLVEGHTDDKPIGPNLRGKYLTNWELSAGRACSVVHYMSANHDIGLDRLAAIGYGEHRPLGDNDTAEGRATNRRVVIVIGPKR